VFEESKGGISVVELSTIRAPDILASRVFERKRQSSARSASRTNER
jgi:hypothetical protein